MVAVGLPPAVIGGRRRPRGSRRVRPGRGAVLLVSAVYFLGPLAAAFWFSVRDTGGITWHAYTQMFSAQGFTAAITLSFELAAVAVLVTIALMLPTMLLVQLRFPRVTGLVETLSLFPLVIPPVVLVVGVGKVLSWGTSGDQGGLKGEVFNQLLNSNPPFVLALVYVVLALPFTYRAIAAGLRGADVRTLVEAAQNLGASWPTVVLRVVLPTLRTSLLNAAFLTFALSFGEFTIASILQYQPFSVWLLQFNGADGQLTVALSLMSLLLTWGLLLLLTAVAGRDPSARRTEA
jgi:putative spermidine/putrescine transport system permease protein